MKNKRYFIPGVCYDYVNNQIWTSSEDCIEEWSNVGALSYHHVVDKLGPKPTGINKRSLFIF